MRLIRWVSFSIFILLALPILAAAQAGRYTVQLVASPSQAEADEKVAQLKSKGVEAYILKSQVPGKGTFYRVRVGMFPNANEARKFGASLKQQGVVPEFFIAPFERAKEEVASAGKNSPKAAALVNNPPPVSAPAAKNPPPVSAPAAKETAKPAGKSDPPATPATKEPAASTAAPPAPAVNFARFQDPQVGFSFEYPSYWTGNSLSTDDAKAQRINAGAQFQSSEDSAFLQVIWNELDKANNPTNDNDLIIDVILKSMRSGDGTQTMEELTRKMVEDKEKGQIKTFLDLRASFQMQGQSGLLEFLGKAVIIRASRGILLVAAFYSKSSPANVAGVADKIIASVKAPE